MTPTTALVPASPAGMRIKSYFATSVETAISQARVELGADALLLNTRKSAETEGDPRYEVVMGLPGLKPAAETELVAAAPVEAPQEGVETALIRMHEQISGMQELLVQMTKEQTVKKATPSELVELHERLLKAQFDPELSKDIAARLERLIGTGATDSERLEKLLRTDLSRRIRFRADVGVEDRSLGPVVAIIGPSGVGKTTAIAKLATALSTEMPVRILSLDAGKPGGLQHLQALAECPAVRRSSVKMLDYLPQLVADAREKECVFIDTPSIDASNQEAIARVLSQVPELDVHLVAPAYMSGPDLRRCIERYQAFRPEKLLVTKVDESQTLGAIVSESRRAGLALSFLSNGPRIPYDICPATIDTVMSTIGESARARAHHAA